jgi:hypothetical protein
MTEVCPQHDQLFEVVTVRGHAGTSPIRQDTRSYKDKIQGQFQTLSPSMVGIGPP